MGKRDGGVPPKLECKVRYLLEGGLEYLTGAEYVS